MERIRHPQKLGDHLADADAREASFVVLYEGWVEDLQRLHTSLRRCMADRDWELVVVDNPGDDQASARIASLDRVVHVPLRDRVGWAAGRNLGLRLATGRIAIVHDTAVEVSDDVLTSLDAHLSDPTIGLVGRWGITTRDGYHFEEASGPDVDGVEAYFMAMRRSDLVRTGLFDPKFKWYRNADLDFSFRVRDAGFRTIVDPDLALVRHTHRLWETTRGDERDERSRRNFFRFRDHWAERRDLFVELGL